MLRNSPGSPVFHEYAPSATGSPSQPQELLAPLERAMAWVWLSIERGRQRRALLQLDDRQLRDVGLTRTDVQYECAKPIWRP